MRILFSYADREHEWNCSEWRCHIPANALNKSGKHHAKLLFLESFQNFSDPAVMDIVGPADVIVVQRNFISGEVWDAMDYWRGLKKAVVGDLDDGYPTLPWSNPAHRFWIENAQQLPYAPIELLTEGLRHCNALTSPSRVILDDWKHIVHGLHLPNYAYAEWYNNLEGIKARRDKKRVVIGYGGSVSHYDAWWFSGAREALEHVVKQRPQVLIKVCGNDPRIFEQLDVSAANKVMQPGVAPADWPKVVASFDIGIAPLDLREGLDSYDQRRSWLKCLEYALAAVPWVASRGEPYRDFFEQGLFVENTAQAWEEALLRTIDNYEQAEQAARRAQKRAWSLTAEQAVDKIVEVYERALLLNHSTPALPNVFYVKGNAAPSPTPPQNPTTVPPTDAARLALRNIQHATFVAAREWHKPLGLEFNDVNLGESMRYDFQQRLNQEMVERH